MLVLLLFFCSGATALVYEVLWSKYLSLMLGSSVQAQTVVLAVFMGGLAIGNRLFGNRAALFREPLSIYGYLEIAIGLYAFFFYKIYQGADFLFVSVGQTVSEQQLILFALKLVLSLGLLILPTILMGGTLPLMASWLQKQPDLDRGARVGVFYAVNSLGAVAGAGLAGFVLVQSLGMVVSLEMTALANLVIGLIAIILSKRSMLQLRTEEQAETARLEKVKAAGPSPVGWFGLLVAGTGGASMGLEVIYARALALIVGGSLQAFALVLMSFILGIGIGSLLISSSKIARKLGASTIYLLLLGAATMVVLNVTFIENIAITFANMKYGLALNESGWVWHQMMIALTAFVVLGFPAAFLGATVPLAIRLLESEGGDFPERVGRLLTWNTLGAVSGVLLTGFVLMPVLGLRGAMVFIAMILIGIVIGMAYKREQTKMVFLGAACALATVLAVTTTGQQWKEVLSAGIFRLRGRTFTKETFRNINKNRELVYYKDAADATVSVERSLQNNDPGQLTLRINGKSDASTKGDLSTQYLVAHLPMLANPDAKEVFILGFGSGISAGALLGHPVEKITIAENCGPVLEAGHLFNDWNRGVLTNSRTVIKRDDARAVLKLGQKKYDVIISEPSNPWVVGVGSVFSREFYELASKHLNDDGIMAQWFHIYEMNDQIVMLVIRTFSMIFPFVEIWDTQGGDIVMLGGKKPWRSDPAHWQQVFDRPEVRADLEKIGLKTAVSLYMRQSASQDTSYAVPDEGPIQTDEFPILEYAAPRAFYVGGRSAVLSYYDERALQFPLARSEKLAVLRALPHPVIKDVFDFYDTSNPDLGRYLSAYIRDPEKLPGIDPLLHIAFRKPESYPADPPIRANASEEFKQVTQLEAALLRNPDQWQEAAHGIEAILQKLVDAGKFNPDFSGAFYAAFCAKIATANQDYLTALRFLRLGYVFAPDDQHLHYISRILDRRIPIEMMVDLRKIRAEAEASSQPPATGDTNAPAETNKTSSAN